jgi:hypothetical protein
MQVDGKKLLSNINPIKYPVIMIDVKSCDSFKFNFKLYHVNWPLTNTALEVLGCGWRTRLPEMECDCAVDKGWSSSRAGTNSF